MIKQTAALYKNAYRGLSRDTWWLSLVMLVNRSGTMVVPFMTIYLTQSLHFSIAEAGIVLAVFGLGAIIGALIGGRLTDRIGFHKIQLFTLTGGGVFFILLGQMRQFPLICIGTFLLSLVNEAFRPANASAIAFYSKPENRTRSYSLHRLAINLGWACGGALGGFIASINYSLLFWVDGVTNLLAAILLWRALTPVTLVRQTTTKHHREKIKNSAFRDRHYIWFIILTSIFAICFFQNFSLLPVYLKENMQLPEYIIGLVLGLNGLIIALVEMVLVFKLEGKRDLFTFISLGVLLTGISFVILNILPVAAGTLAVISVMLITVGEMLSMPFMNSFWVARSNAGNRGQYASLYTVAYSTAQVLGPTIGSQIVRFHGFAALWWSIGLVSLLNAIAFQVLAKKIRAVRVPNIIPIETREEIF